MFCTRHRERWIHEPAEETFVLEAMIAKVMNEVFGLKLQVFSEHYAGEDFGKKVCYRMIYRGQRGKRIQVLFVLEKLAS